ncbi:MAG: hypothetical protein KGI73_04965 [Patescibacteria group bacterium]|nr:hypothetical protein [Patescibacteria group bacterium]
MTLLKVAEDLKRKPTGKEKSRFMKQLADFQRRFVEGSLAPDLVLPSWQNLSEGFVVIGEAEGGLYLTGELSIQVPALPRPTLEELKAKYGIKSIERDTSPVEPVTLNLAAVLRANESSIDENVYEERLAPHLPLLLGYQHCQWLLKHQLEFPVFMTLLGRVYVDFLGIVAVDEDDGRGYTSTAGVGGLWGGYWRRFEYDFYRHGRVAVSGPGAPVGAGK